MFCEHPTCKSLVQTICKSHCSLSVCEEHRIEHEKNLLKEFEKQLDDLSNPLSTFLHQSRSNLKKSEESYQNELNRINSIFDHHLSSINQRFTFSKTIHEFILNKRKQVIKYKTGDYQLTKDDYQQIENFSNDIQFNLQEQYQLNNYIKDKNSEIHLWPINKENNVSKKEIECIEISDSEDESRQNSTDHDTSVSNNTQVKSNKKQESNLLLVRDFCPLTQIGIYGLNRSHNLSRLCSKTSNKQRALYIHFTHYHVIKSSIAYQLVKAIRNGCDPNETKIFPQDNTSVCIENISCPFDETARKFTKKNSIPNTPCHASLAYHYFKNHLRNVHSITKLNAELIFKAMKEHGTISHVQFEEDLCEN